jgi:membrane-associated HD superfamily phosphohydrolase
MSDKNLDAEYTLNEYSTRRIPLCGSVHTYPYLQKVIAVTKLKETSKSSRKTSQYSVSSIENAINDYNNLKTDAKGSQNYDNEARQALRDEKLKEDTLLTKKKRETAELNLEVLRNNLLSREDIVAYLSTRMAIEGSILRQLLFTQIPIEITGLTIPNARKKTTEYYNKLMEVYAETIALFDERYPIKNIEEVEKEYDPDKEV